MQYESIDQAEEALKATHGSRLSGAPPPSARMLLACAPPYGLPLRACSLPWAAHPHGLVMYSFLSEVCKGLAQLTRATAAAGGEVF